MSALVFREYDARNRLISETNTRLDTRSFVYDGVGNQIGITDRNERTRTFSYDALNRQVAENWLDDEGEAIRIITSSYDAASQLITTSDPDSSYGFTYDLLGRLTTVDNAGTPNVPNVVLSYEYDSDGNLIAVSDEIDGESAGVTTYTYDELDRVSRITQSGSEVAEKRVNFTFDAIGQYEAISRYSNLEGTQLVVQSNYAYDAINRLVNLTH